MPTTPTRILVAALVAGFSSLAHAQVTFMGLGPDTGFAYSVSDDGSVVVGQSPSLAYRWTQGTGSVSLGTLPGSPNSVAISVSGDGSVVAGYLTGGSALHPVRWTQATGLTDLGGLPGASGTNATAVSRDGTTIVGTGSYPAPGYDVQAFRWTESTGLVGLGTLGGNYSDAFAVSADGSHIVGGSTLANGRERAFLWTSGSGMTSLGTLHGDTTVATAINSDGSIIIGFEEAGNGDRQAFIWTPDDGMQALGDSANFTPTGLSDDGSFIISKSNGLIWTPASGARRLIDVLRFDYSLEDQLEGWGNLIPFDVTPDGRFVVGWGLNNGVLEGWLLDRGLNPPDIAPGQPPVITPVPEPSTVGLAGALLLGCLTLLRRKRISAV